MIDLDKTLVLGASGMLGSQIPFGIRPAHKDVDITDPDSLAKAFEKHAPQAVIHAAGFVDVHRAEEMRDEAERVNVQGSANVADACAQAGIPLVYFSTCMVFDGEKGTAYTESDTPSPQSVYGNTKLRGEQEVLNRADALVVRTGWLFGGFEKDIKFIRRFCLSLLANKPVTATSDRYGSPTYVPDLIQKTVELLQSGERGLAHVVNAGTVSYLDVAEEIKGISGTDADVTGAAAVELDAAGLIRGPMEALTTSRGADMRPYTEPLAEYIAALKVRG